jgi:hypothetical protein
VLHCHTGVSIYLRLLISIAYLTYNSGPPPSFLPETLRSIVGDGSIQPHPFYRPLLPVIGRNRAGVNEKDKPPKKPLVNPFRIFLYPDITILLIFNATLYALMYAVTASISTLFSDIYPFLNQTDIGLCFLAMGGGMAIGSVIGGKSLDWDYQRIKRKLEQQAQNDPESKIRPEDVTKEENFPVEYARFRTIPVYSLIYIASCIGYGWCLDKKVNLAGPLIIQIISECLRRFSSQDSVILRVYILVGYTIMVIMNTTQTLIVDLVPNQSSSVTACVRIYCVHYIRNYLTSVNANILEQRCPLLIRCGERVSRRPHHSSYWNRVDIHSTLWLVYPRFSLDLRHYTHGSKVEGEATSTASLNCNVNFAPPTTLSNETTRMSR